METGELQSYLHLGKSLKKKFQIVESNMIRTDPWEECSYCRQYQSNPDFM